MINYIFIMISINDICISTFTLVFTVIFENVLHKASHYKESGRLYRWHKLHHKDYPLKQLESDVYIDSTGLFNNMFAFWIIVTQAFIFFVSSNHVFTIFYVQTTGYSLIVEYMHQQYHLKQSYWLRFKWFQILKKDHLTHHKKHHQNFGILSNKVDRISKTYITCK